MAGFLSGGEPGGGLIFWGGFLNQIYEELRAYPKSKITRF